MTTKFLLGFLTVICIDSGVLENGAKYADWSTRPAVKNENLFILEGFVTAVEFKLVIHELEMTLALNSGKSWKK